MKHDKTQHTPGPWSVDSNAGKHSDQVAILGPDDYYVSGTCGHATSKLALANAHLIAAAPDLLTQAQKDLKCIQNLLCDIEAGRPLIRQRIAEGLAARRDSLKAVITKATKSD